MFYEGGSHFVNTGLMNAAGAIQTMAAVAAVHSQAAAHLDLDVDTRQLNATFNTVNQK